MIAYVCSFSGVRYNLIAPQSLRINWVEHSQLTFASQSYARCLHLKHLRFSPITRLRVISSELDDGSTKRHLHERGNQSRQLSLSIIPTDERCYSIGMVDLIASIGWLVHGTCLFGDLPVGPSLRQITPHRVLGELLILLRCLHIAFG